METGVPEVIHIRRATKVDAVPMWEMFQAVLAPGDTLPFTEEMDEAEFRRRWLDGAFVSHVASLGSEIAGMYQFGPNHPGRGAHVANATYVVHPRRQGQGIGRALVEHSLAEAARAGYLAMQFNYVVSTNTGAVRLYEKLGFSIVGTLPKAFRHRELGLVDAYVMYRPL